MTVFCIVLSILYRVFTPVLDTPPTEDLTFFMIKSLPGAAATVNNHSPPGLHKTLKAHTSIQPNLNNKKTAGKHCPPLEEYQISSSDSGIISSQSICVG